MEVLGGIDGPPGDRLVNMGLPDLGVNNRLERRLREVSGTWGVSKRRVGRYHRCILPERDLCREDNPAPRPPERGLLPAHETRSMCSLTATKNS